MSQPKNIFDALDSPVWLCSGGRRTSNTLSISKEKLSLVYQNAAAAKSGSFKSCKRAVNHQYSDGTDSSREVDRPWNENTPLLSCDMKPYPRLRQFYVRVRQWISFVAVYYLFPDFPFPNQNTDLQSIEVVPHSNRDRLFRYHHPEVIASDIQDKSIHAGLHAAGKFHCLYYRNLKFWNKNEGSPSSFRSNSTLFIPYSLGANVVPCEVRAESKHLV